MRSTHYIRYENLFTVTIFCDPIPTAPSVLLNCTKNFAAVTCKNCLFEVVNEGVRAQESLNDLAPEKS